MALKYLCYPSSSSSSSSLSCFVVSAHYSYFHNSSLPQLFRTGRLKAPRPFSLSATSRNPNASTSLSSPPIFLSFLLQQEEEEEDPKLEPQQREEEEEEEILNSIGDPILRFFKSRSSIQHTDPSTEGKLSLQKNRRTSWHLAPTINDVTSIHEDETEPPITTEFKIENEQLGYVNKGSVGEILELARNLPENSTLGELLRSYEGRVGERESVEVLGLMGQEGLAMECLYFFEWMGLQEPSLVTPRACSALFPALGRAGMGDKLMVLFRNLPNVKQFREVHVYNAAISSLLCCGRLKTRYTCI